MVLAIVEVASSIRYLADELGTNKACAPNGAHMGGLEVLAMQVKDGSEAIAAGMDDIAEELAACLDGIGTAITALKSFPSV